MMKIKQIRRMKQINESSLVPRWGRDEDVQVYKTLGELWAQEDIEVETFWGLKSSLTDDHHWILEEIAKKYGWKRSTAKMLKRIKNLRKQQKMSVRQMRLFRKLKRKAKREKVTFDLEKIVHMFPGKLVSTLEACMNK